MDIKEAALVLAPIGEIAGGVFGHTYARRHLRRKMRPETATPAQKKAREDWALTDAAWSARSPEEKQLWRDWKPWYKCWGYNMFMKVNYPRQRSGDPLLPEPPDYPPWV